ncbi:MAG: DUF6515 family protein [Rubrivivax sp.]|nr:DUF6515 family protein [Rubrivivax sp.]
MNRIRHALSFRHGLALSLAFTALLATGTAQADPRERGGDRGSRIERGGDRGGDRHRGAPPPRVSPAPQRWFDGAHGHNHHYPRPGWSVRTPPPRANITFWGGVGYRHYDGIWYTGGPRGYVVVRPPIGIVITDRPALATVLAIGGLTYLYANGVYYREQPGVGYEVVPPPVDGDNKGTTGKTYVYPTLSQSAEQQATDEYGCHKWAVTQSGFDPSGAATGQAPGPTPARRGDYERARGACLEGRGYTVR